MVRRRTVAAAPTSAGGMSPLATVDLTEATVVVVPSVFSRWAAAWAGRRDGRRGIVPDPQTGITPYLHTLISTNATMVESERLRTQAHLAPIDQERAVHVHRRDCALAALDELDTSTIDGDDATARIRADRARTARRQSLHGQIAAATERIGVLDERRADRITVGALRIQRCTERTESLVARYWRAFARRHPELPELRAGYTVPVVPVPPHPLGL